ncbi:phage integrase SAM-like domain-containing protein [Bacteroides fragilis]|uniref:tyrosine-type recombinase/integrase n=1 Tax=Bacteroides fragilis TaxID=817 RepID=UPI00202EB104|nr:phage integrase SAM-like domain-containing protein [Bacteroides fragilis]MCM0207407.1 phage integrase SAM-like domain-containing protein [Bacteroides fragilis]
MSEQQIFFRFSFHFNLRKPNGEHPTAVYMVFRLDGKQYKYYIGAKVNPLHWNKTKQKAVISPLLTVLDNNNNSIVNAKIDAAIKKFDEVKLYLCNHPNLLGNIDGVIKEKLFNVSGVMKKNKESHTIFNPILYLRKMIDDSSLKDKKAYYSKVNTFGRYLRDKDITLTSFNNIDYKFFEEFRNFLLNEKNSKGKPKRTIGTVENNIDVIMGLIKRSERDGLFNSSIACLHLYSKLKPKVDVSENHYALTEDELDRIYLLRLNGEEENVRNAFILQCFFGQRYGDMKRMKDFIVRSDNTIEIVQEKTTHRPIVPLLPRSKEILDNIKANNIKAEYKDISTSISILQRIAKKAGITEAYTQLRETIEGVEEVHGLKYEFIGTHTARRTFVTMCSRRGISESLIMATTGHKSIANYHKYDKETQREKANKLAMYFDEADKKENIDNSNVNAETLNLIHVISRQEVDLINKDKSINYIKDKEDLFMQRVEALNMNLEHTIEDNAQLNELIISCDNIKDVHDIIERRNDITISQENAEDDF